MDLYFAGGVGTITGAATLLSVGTEKILVDCGLSLDPRERHLVCAMPPCPPAEITAIFLTNASIDNSGCIPHLVKRGFRGKVFCSPLTLKLCEIHLLDHARALEEDFQHLKAQGETTPEPIYSQSDVGEALKLFRAVPFFESFEITPGIECTISYGGYLPGASQAIFNISGRQIMFSGNLGRELDPVMLTSSHPSDLDYLIVNSTLGSRQHSEGDEEVRLARLIWRTISRKGQLLIPIFNVGRLRALLYRLYCLKSSGKIPNISIFHDSPYSIRKYEIFSEMPHDLRITSEQIKSTCELTTQIETYEDSIRLMRCKKPKIILAGNARLVHGRAVRHFENLATDPANTVAFVEHQPQGSRGSSLLKGFLEMQVFKKPIHVKAEIINLEELTPYADSAETVRWMKGFYRPPLMTFLTHGESPAREHLQAKISNELKWRTYIPKPFERVSL